MKLGKPEICTILILVAMVIYISINIANKYGVFEDKNAIKIYPIISKVSTEKQLPKNIREISKKYNAYQDLYSSDKLTLIYNYTDSKSDDELAMGIKFHEKLTKALEKEKLDYRYVIYNNWKDDSLEVTLRNKKYLDDTDSCKTPVELDLQEYILTSQECIVNVCLMDVKNHRFYTLTPDVEYVISELKAYQEDNK